MHSWLVRRLSGGYLGSSTTLGSAVRPGQCQRSLLPEMYVTRRRRSSDRCHGSGQGEEEFLHGLDVHGILPVGLRQTLLEAGRDDGEAGPVQGAVHRSELGDDVLAVAALLDHAQDAADLALGSAQPVDHGAHLVRVQLNHRGSFEVVVLNGSAQLSVCLLYTSPSPRDGLLSRMPS